MQLTNYSVCVYVLVARSCLSLVTVWTVAHQAPLSMGFSRQEYWSGLPIPTSGDLPHPGIEPSSLASPPLAGGFFSIVPQGKPKLGKIRLDQISRVRLFVTPWTVARQAPLSMGFPRQEYWNGL